MKKRIISLILVVVMLTLALAGCGDFDYATEDMTGYADFNKDAFWTAITDGSLNIVDGDFTEDAETRAKRIEDDIYSKLSSKASSTDKKNEGTPGAHDIFYYSYYMKVTKGDVDYYFNASTMADGKETSVQLGKNFPTDLEKKILEAFADYSFAANFYDPAINGTVKENQVVLISYTRSYKANDEAGTAKEDKATNHIMTLDPQNPFAAKLLNLAAEGETAKPATIGTTISGDVVVELDKTDANYEKYAGTYKNVKIVCAMNEGVEIKSFDMEAYDEKTELTPTLVADKADKIDVNGCTPTYYVYPVAYSTVDEYNAENIINLLYGKDISLSTLKTILFGTKFSELTEEEQNAKLDSMKITVGGEELSLSDFVETLVTAQKDYADAKTKNDEAKKKYEGADGNGGTKNDLSLAESAVTEAEATLAEAKKAVEDAGEAATEEQKKAVTDAEEALKKKEEDKKSKEAANTIAREDYEGADGNGGTKKKFEDARTKRDERVSALINKATADTIVNGHKNNVIKVTLKNTYYTDINTKLATEIYKLIINNTKVKTRPEGAVEDAKEYLMQNYEYCYYKNVALGDDTVAEGEATLYFQYKSFEEFIQLYAVKHDLGVTANSYEEAIAAIDKAAEAHVDEMIAIYSAAQALGKTVTDDMYEDYIESDEYDYTKEAYNGAEAARFAYQFDFIMNYLLESDETEDGESYTWSIVKFSRNKDKDVTETE